MLSAADFWYQPMSDEEPEICSVIFIVSSAAVMRDMEITWENHLAVLMGPEGPP